MLCKLFSFCGTSGCIHSDFGSSCYVKCSGYVVHLVTFILIVDHHLYESTCSRRVLPPAAQHLTTLQVILNVNDTVELCVSCSSCTENTFLSCFTLGNVTSRHITLYLMTPLYINQHNST